MNDSQSNFSVRVLEEETRRKIAVFTCWVLVVTTSINVFLRIFQYGQVTWGTITSILIVLVFAILAILIKSAKNLDKLILFFNISAFIFAPLIMAQTGGLASPALIAVFAFVVLIAFSLSGTKLGSFSLFWHVGFLFLFAFFKPQLDLTLSPFAKDANGLLIISIIGMALIISPVLLILKEKDLFATKLREYEKRESANVIMKRIAHEFGNSIHISINYLQFLKGDSPKRDEYIEVATRNLKEMDQIVKGMVKISDEGDLIEYLKQAENEIKILNQLSQKEKP